MANELIVQGMIRSRLASGMSLDQAYENVLQTIQRDKDELAERDHALAAELRRRNESPEYIKFRLDPFAIEIEKHINLSVAARDLQSKQWRPA